jgi:8-hydroxy-5-deazaflavin:NADPH oxidoreductase
VRIAVLGTGAVGRALADRLAGLGHEVTVGTRDPDRTRERSEPDGMGNPPFAVWLAKHPDVPLLTFQDAAAGAELVFVATSGAATIPALELAGAEHLAGKVVVDVSNPLDFSGGMPPSLFVKDTDSLAEMVQRAFPGVRVVKTLNTMTARVMVDPAALGEDSSVFVSGDDAEAKATVVALLESFGHRDVIDLGDLTSARGAEMILPIWLRLMSSLGTTAFNFRIVR